MLCKFKVFIELSDAEMLSVNRCSSRVEFVKVNICDYNN